MILSSGIAVAALSCSKGDVTTPTTVPDVERPASIRMVPTEIKNVPGYSDQIKADVLNSSGGVMSNAKVTWSTSDANVVTVSSEGAIRMAGVGQATVQAQYGALVGLTNIVVSPPAPVPVATIEFELSPTIDLGASRLLVATARDASGNALPDRIVTFSSSNPLVASTSPSGLLQAVTVGTVQITASAEGRQSSRTITVIPLAVASVALTPTRLDLLVNASGIVTASAFAANGAPLTGRVSTYSSSAPTIATVDNGGVVVGKTPGTAIITGAIEGKSASATVVVSPLVVTPAGMDVDVTSPTDISGVHLNIDGPGLSAPISMSQQTAAGRRTASLHVVVPPGGPYRVRVIGSSAWSPNTAVYVATTGMSSNVIVPVNSFVRVGVATAAPTVSFVAPSAVNASDPVDITWTVVDPGASLDRTGGPTGGFWYGYGRMGDGYGTPLSVTATKVSATTFRYTAHFTAPAVGTKIYYQFESRTFDPASSVWGQTGHLFTPLLNSGDTAYTMRVTPSATPIRLAITSSIPTDEYVVIIDGGPLGISQTVSGVSGSMMTSGTATISLAPGGPYRIRVLSPSRVAPIYLTAVVNETGVIRNVNVVAGVPLALSVSLAAPSVAISIPTSAKLGQPLDVSWTYTDPGEALDLGGPPLGLIQYNEYSDADFVGTKQSVTGVRVNATTYQFTARIPTASTTGKLFYHVGAQVIDMPIQPLSRVGWYLNPSQVRLEPVPFITLTP